MYSQLRKIQSSTLFNESIRSKYTQKNYHSHLTQFLRFTGRSSIDSLLSIPQDDLQCMLENYLLELKQTSNPNSVPSKFQGIKHFCVMNRIHINWEIIRRMFPQRQKTQNLRAYTDEEIRELLSNSKGVRDNALIHFMASTGARVGVFDCNLSLAHIQPMPHKCKAVKLYADEVEEYWGFLTPQASRALDSYHARRRKKGEVFCEDTPLFATNNANTKQLTWNGARTAIYRTISRSQLSRKKSNGRYDVQADHGFRKRFNTILKLDNSVNYNIAEKLLGHKNGLDGVYFVPTLEEMFAEFQKVVRKIEV